VLSSKCIVEIQLLSDRAAQLARGSVSDRAESSALLAKIKNLREAGESSDELRARYAEQTVLDARTDGKPTDYAYQRAFEKYVFVGDERSLEPEQRSLLAGSLSLQYSTGSLGGYLVPWVYNSTLFKALAQTDPLLSSDVCDFVVEPTSTLQPQQIIGYDLSTISAVQISESSNQAVGTFPAVSGKTMRSNITYRLSLGASFEAEEDVPGTLQKMAAAYGVGFARRLGADATVGNGIGSPQGIQTALTSSYTSWYMNGEVYQDWVNIFFNVNALYRSQPKCAWLMSDSVYQRLRKTTDPLGRPILDMIDDREMLLGKKIFISPSLGVVGGSPAQNSTVIFGDLSYFHIRCSAPTMQRAINTPGFIETGQALYVARIRMDSQYLDPSNGATPPITSATIQA
jgi:HK97 family phage major capsid protein